MTSRARHFLIYWAPPLLWMALIFFLSSRQRISITHTSTYDFLIFKSLHLIEYALLYFLLFRALYTTRLKAKKVSLLAFSITALYAISDELHQTFVPTRDGNVRDVLIDWAGAYGMLLITNKHLRTLQKWHIL